MQASTLTVMREGKLAMLSVKPQQALGRVGRWRHPHRRMLHYRSSLMPVPCHSEARPLLRKPSKASAKGWCAAVGVDATVHVLMRQTAVHSREQIHDVSDRGQIVANGGVDRDLQAQRQAAAVAAAVAAVAPPAAVLVESARVCASF